MNIFLNKVISIIKRNISSFFIFLGRFFLIIGSIGFAIFVGLYIDPFLWTCKFVLSMDLFLWLKLLLYFFIIFFGSVLFIFAGVWLITNKKRLPSAIGSLIFLDIIYVTIYFLPSWNIFSFISKDFAINLNLIYWLVSLMVIILFYMIVYLNKQIFVK